jgi:hypothetical protein
MNENTPYTVAEVAKMLHYSPQFITLATILNRI